MKIYRRLLSALLASLMLCALLPLGVFADYEGDPRQTEMTFSIQSVEVPAEATEVTVALWLTNLTDEDDLGTVDVRVKYDETKLRQTDVYAQVGSGRNAEYYGPALFEGGFQLSPPASDVNPLVFIAWTTSMENPCYASEYEMNLYEFAFIDFEFIGDWQGRTELEIVCKDGTPGVETLLDRANDAPYVGYQTVNGYIQRGEYTEPAPDPVLESIAVTTPPTKTEYLESAPGEFDPAGGKLTLTYDDESTEEIDLSEAVVTGFDDTQVGPQTLTVTYEGKTCTLEVTILPASITGISVDALPSKLTYIEGEELDLTGGMIEVAYNNGTYAYQRMLNATVTGYDKNTVGPQTLTVTYEGFTCTFEVEVVAKEIIGIVPLTSLTKVLYLEGKDELDLSGGTFRVFYNNNTSDDLPLSAATVTGFDNTVPGTCVLNVAYAGFSTQISVEIVAKAIDHIVVTKNPDKTTYFLGESLDLTGGEITVRYNNDTSDVIALSEVVVTGFDSASAGTQTLTAEYQQHTAGFEVTVVEKEITGIEVTTLPNKLVYKENKPGERELDPTGGIITVTYEDSSTSTIALSEATLSGFDTFTVGEQYITVSYAGLTCTYPVTVEAKVPVSIVVFDKPAQTEYLEGYEPLSLEGGTLHIVYDNETYDGLSMNSGDVSVTGFDNTVVGKQTLTVHYAGLTCNYEVEIIAKSIESIAITGMPEKTYYLEGEELTVAGGQLTLHYNNGTHGVVDMTLDMVTGYDKDLVGEQNLLVTYKGVSNIFGGEPCYLPVTVIAKTAESISLTKNPDKMQYLLGSTEPFDPTGGEITVYYNNDTQKVVPLAEAVIIGFETLYEGPVWLDVYYESCDLQFTVDIVLKQPLVITKQPEELVVKAYKDTAEVTVAATGEGELTYAWYYKDKNMVAFKLTTTFTGDTYSVAMTGARSGRQIYCKITDEFGDEITTDVCTLAMEARIAKQPASVTVAYGKTATVTVKAEGEGLVYKWYYKNKGATKFVRTTTFSGDTYTVEMNASRSGRQIYVIVEDQFGNRVASKIVTLSMEARIATQPKSVTVASGELAKTTVKAQGEGLTYTWYYKDKGASKFVKTSSFTGASYYVYMNNARNGRQVYCKITDKFGNTVTTNTVTLKMK